jgi:transcriptional regulator with XRE-family HTH domain
MHRRLPGSAAGIVPPGRTTMTGIGHRLREAREARRIPIEQVERDTRIVRRYLLALENEDFGVFPAEVYARGFLRSYASYLGLDGAELVSLMPQPEPPEEETARRQRPRAGSGSGRTQASPRSEVPGSRALKPALAVLVILLAAFALGRIAGRGPDPFAPAVPGAVAGIGAPAAGTTNAANPTGRMPDLRGMTESDAVARLQGMGVTPFVIEVSPGDGTGGRVTRQSPAPGTPLDRLTVSVVVEGGS